MTSSTQLSFKSCAKIESWQTNSSSRDTLTITIKLCYHGNSLFSSPYQSVFHILVIFSSEAYLYVYQISKYQNFKYQNERPKLARKAHSIRGLGTQYVAMVTKLLSSCCGTQLVEYYYNESNVSDANWLRYFFLHI